MDDLRGKRVTVAGLGKFGGNIAAARWLVDRGADVLVTDRQPPEKLEESLRQLDGLKVRLRLGGHDLKDFQQADLVVTSPALAPTNQFIAAARDAGVPVTTEIRLFLERCNARVIAVTGTKGKSTTTALLGRMLEWSAGGKVWIGGNIGRSLLADVQRIGEADLVVLEVSSFMLEYLGEMRWSPHVAVVTMLAADHIDWHGSEQAYLEAKKNIVRFQTPENFAVLGENLPHTDEFARATKARVVRFNTRGKKFNLLIPGEHNQFNAQAAFAAASLFGVNWDAAQDAIKDFPGLPHRLQLVHECDGVRYYNDSIATIPQAAVAALKAFPSRTVIQIVGGYDKGLLFDELARALSDHAKVVLCIGTTGAAIASLLDISTTRVKQCQTLESAMQAARDLAVSGDVVLLSPGCASYDQFANFEQRGERFVQLGGET